MSMSRKQLASGGWLRDTNFPKFSLYALWKTIRIVIAAHTYCSYPHLSPNSVIRCSLEIWICLQKQCSASRTPYNYRKAPSRVWHGTRAAMQKISACGGRILQQKRRKSSRRCIVLQRCKPKWDVWIWHRTCHIWKAVYKHQFASMMGVSLEMDLVIQVHSYIHLNGTNLYRAVGDYWKWNPIFAFFVYYCPCRPHGHWRNWIPGYRWRLLDGNRQASLC